MYLGNIYTNIMRGISTFINGLHRKSFTIKVMLKLNKFYLKNIGLRMN